MDQRGKINKYSKRSSPDISLLPWTEILLLCFLMLISCFPFYLVKQNYYDHMMNNAGLSTFLFITLDLCDCHACLMLNMEMLDMVETWMTCGFSQVVRTQSLDSNQRFNRLYAWYLSGIYKIRDEMMKDSCPQTCLYADSLLNFPANHSPSPYWCSKGRKKVSDNEDIVQDATMWTGACSTETLYIKYFSYQLCLNNQHLCPSHTDLKIL